jgi:excisionase family DNA binding protein
MNNYLLGSDQPDCLLNATQIAAILNVSKPQVFLMIRRGDFPVVKMGRLVRVRRSAIEDYINKQTIPPNNTS